MSSIHATTSNTIKPSFSSTHSARLLRFSAENDSFESEKKLNSIDKKVNTLIRWRFDRLTKTEDLKVRKISPKRAELTIGQERYTLERYFNEHDSADEPFQVLGWILTPFRCDKTETRVSYISQKETNESKPRGLKKWIAKLTKGKFDRFPNVIVTEKVLPPKRIETSVRVSPESLIYRRPQYYSWTGSKMEKVILDPFTALIGEKGFSSSSLKVANSDVNDDAEAFFMILDEIVFGPLEDYENIYRSEETSQDA